MKIPGAVTIDGDFWQGRRVLVTGHTGFKGAWLSLWLQSLGAELTGLSSGEPTVPSLYAQAGVAAGMRSPPHKRSSSSTWPPSRWSVARCASPP